jgi:hypothetical protein
MDYMSVVDAWVYSKEWVKPDLIITAEIEMSFLGRKQITLWQRVQERTPITCLVATAGWT